MDSLPEDLLQKFLEETKKPEEVKEEPKVEIPEGVIVHDKKAFEKMQRESAKQRLNALFNKSKAKRVSAGVAYAGKMKNPSPSVTFGKEEQK